MLFVYPNLVTVMKKRDMSYKDLAAILGISEYATYRRLRGFTGWKLNETLYLCQYFGIPDAAWLFKLCDTVSQKF